MVDGIVIISIKKLNIVSRTHTYINKYILCMEQFTSSVQVCLLFSIWGTLSTIAQEAIYKSMSRAIWVV